MSDDGVVLQIPTQEKLIIQETGGPGPVGPQGPSGTLAIHSVTTLPAGSAATVVNVGTPQNAQFDLGLPKGDTGDPFSNIDGGNATSVYGGIVPIDGGGVS